MGIVVISSSLNGLPGTINIVDLVSKFIYIGDNFYISLLVLVPYIVVIVPLPSVLGLIANLSPIYLGIRSVFCSLLEFTSFTLVMSPITEVIQSDSVQLLINLDSGNV